MATKNRIVLGLVLISVAACSTEAPPATPTPTPTPTPSPIVSVSINGVPASPAVGQTVQLTAQLTRQDGMSADGTSQVTWLSSDLTVVTVSAAGLLTIAAPGDADVTATLQAVRGTAHVTVPKPVARPVLYDLEGVVHESAPTDNVALAGATVGIHVAGCPTCPHDNESTTTDATGRFRFPGIEAGGFSLVVSKPGYETTSYSIAQLPRDQHPDVGVNPSLTTVRQIFEGVFQQSDYHPNFLATWRDTEFPVHHSGSIVMEECDTAILTEESHDSALLRRLRFKNLAEADQVVSSPCGAIFGNGATWTYQAQAGFIYTIRVLGSGGRMFRAVFTHPN
jgi:carboxypeptidase family protein/Big-like domain-containing protein